MEADTKQLNISGLLPDFGSLGVYPESAEQLSALFVAVIIGVAALFLFVSLVAFLKANLRTSWIRRLLKRETSRSVVMNRQEFTGSRPARPVNSAGHLWKEFDETLVEARVGEEIHLHNIYDANHFFNSSTLAPGMTESRYAGGSSGLSDRPWCHRYVCWSSVRSCQS
jgi:hypothetical protein